MGGNEQLLLEARAAIVAAHLRGESTERAEEIYYFLKEEIGRGGQTVSEAAAAREALAQIRSGGGVPEAACCGCEGCLTWDADGDICDTCQEHGRA